MRTPRMTLQVQRVVEAMLREPAERFYGLQLCGLTGLPSGSIYPILARLEDCEWVESKWEDVAEVDEGRPRRRYYRLTSDGADYARAAMQAIRSARLSAARRWGVAAPGASGAAR